MASRIFLDANILLDYFLKRSAFDQARLLFRYILDGRVSAYVSPSIVHLVGHWVAKYHGPQKAKEILLHLLDDVTVLEMNHDVTLLALRSSMADIEDALQYYTAMHHKAEVFISQDRQLKKSASPSLPVMTLDEFLKTL
jgi:predicted nucleic acid-binding protein